MSLSSFEAAAINREPGVPVAAKGDQTNWIASASPANTNWLYSSILTIGMARYITLYVKIDGAGGVAAQDVRIVPFVSSAAVVPASGDDSWYALPYSDGAVTAEALVGGTVPAGADWTKTPEFGSQTLRPFQIKGEVLDNSTDKVRIAIPLDVSRFKWIQLAYADVSAAATKALIAVDYSFSA